MQSTPEFDFDVFLSHSAKDKAVVRAIAERLRADGLRVWFDEWIIKPGDSIPAKIEEGLESSHVLALCMSANAFGSDWARLESYTFRFSDPMNTERRFIPLRLDDAPVKASLAHFLYISWDLADREQEYPKLLEGCRPVVKPVAALDQANARDFTPALTDISSDLREFEYSDHLRKCPGYPWSSEDQPPKAVGPGEIVIGHRVNVSFLKKGYFADRPIFHELAQKAEQWIEKVHSGREAGRKLSLFWIGGRSGTGKSIALLHVLAMLHAHENNRVIVWLENIDALPDCFSWARPLLQDSREVLIGIDDPFPADREDDLARILISARQELSGLQRGQVEARFPLIVCSGPTEQRLRFFQQFRELAAITPVELPKETAKDRAALWEWYQSRRDKEGRQPYTPEQDVLLVQLFFEWWTGQPIRAFATSFLRRLRGLDQTPGKSFVRFLDSLFAINRLGVNYPKELVEKELKLPAFANSFNLLRQESHLTVEEGVNHPGVRIAHPHLANAIYEAWYPRDSHFEQRRRSHLETVIFRSLEDCSRPRDKLAVLWAIARLAVDAAAQSRLPSATTATLLEHVTEEMQRGFGKLPVYILPVLIELQAVYPSTKFAFSPLRTACDALDRQLVTETGFRLLCHKVLQHHEALQKVDAPATERAIESIRSVLRHKMSWVEWPHIAVDYQKTVADHAIESLIGHWITSHVDQVRTPLFIRDIIEFTQSDGVIKASLVWLNRVDPNVPDVPFVLQALLTNCKDNEPLCLFARCWLDDHDWNKDQWTFVWEALGRAVHTRHRFTAKTTPKRRVTSQELTPFKEHVRTPRAWIRDTSLERIVGHLSHFLAGWYRFFGFSGTTSISHDLSDRGLFDYVLAKGRDWLDNNDQRDQHPAWPGALALLIEFTRDDADLRQRGWTWLKQANFDHGSWTFMWEALEETTRQGWEDRDELILRGRRWLLENSAGKSHGAYLGVLTCLINALPDDSYLRRRGWKWIRSSDLAHPSWSWLWCAIEFSTRGAGRRHRKVLIELGVKWLNRTPLTNRGWTIVWKRICEDAKEISADYETEEPNSDPIDELRRLRAKWILQFTPNDPSFGSEWEIVFDLGERSETFLDLGLSWSKDRLGERQSSFILKKLSSSGTRYDEFFNELVEWVSSNDISVKSWAAKLLIVLKWLERPDKLIDNDFFARARASLDEDITRSLWGEIWVSLYKQRVGDPVLVRNGREWVVKGQSQKSDAWASVLLHLTDDLDTLDELIEPAVAWLSIAQGRKKWREVWKRLWDRTRDCQKLGPLALRWLQQNRSRPKQREAWEEIWSTLWNAGCQQDELQRLKE